MPPILQVAVDQVPMLVAVDPGNVQPRAAHRHLQYRRGLHRQRRRQNLEAHLPIPDAIHPPINLGQRLRQVLFENVRKVPGVEVMLGIQHRPPVNPP